MVQSSWFLKIEHLYVSQDGMKPIEIAALKGSHQGVRILFPHTSKIPTIPDWSEDGIFKHVWRAEAEAEVLLDS